MPDITPHDEHEPRKTYERAEAAASWVSASGLEVAGLHRFLFLWKRFGFAGTLIVLAIVGVPASEYSLLSIAANKTVPRLAGDFGVAFEAEWSYRPLSLSAVARNVRIRPEHPASAPPFFTASEVEFQGSLTTALSTVWDLVRLHPLQTFNEITVRHGVLRLERSTQGDLDAVDVWNRVDPRRRDDLVSGGYHVEAISFEDGRIEYIEHLAGDSGSGMIQTGEAKLFVDDITGSLVDVRRLDRRDVTPDRTVGLPTRLVLSGRLADGTIDARGDLGFVAGAGAIRPPAQPGSEPRLLNVSTTESQTERQAGPGPYYVLKIRVDNIGAAAFTRAVPNLDVVATQGTIRGTIELRDNAPCRADAFATGVRYGVNPSLTLVPARLEHMRRASDAFTYTGPYSPCSPVDGAAPGREVPPPGRTMPAVSGAAGLVLAFNRQATATAPPVIRAAVASDTERVTGVKVADAALLDGTDAVAERLGNAATKVLGARTGNAVKETLRSRSTTPASADGSGGENPVAKGAKGIGHGLKKLFHKH